MRAHIFDMHVACRGLVGCVKNLVFMEHVPILKSLALSLLDCFINWHFMSCSQITGSKLTMVLCLVYLLLLSLMCFEALIKKKNVGKGQF